MRRIIVDASVGVKWFFQEEGREAALKILDFIKGKKLWLTVPEIFYLEIANACWKRVCRRLIPSSEANAILEQLVKVPSDHFSDGRIVRAALENALTFEISIYDALYVTLAETYAAPLVTADENLLKACRKRHFEWGEHLKEFDSDLFA